MKGIRVLRVTAGLGLAAGIALGGAANAAAQSSEGDGPVDGVRRHVRSLKDAYQPTEEDASSSQPRAEPAVVDRRHRQPAVAAPTPWWRRSSAKLIQVQDVEEQTPAGAASPAPGAVESRPLDEPSAAANVPASAPQSAQVGESSQVGEPAQVGVATPPPKSLVAADAVTPDIPGVLTREGVLVIEPSIQYQHTNVNNFVVGGVAILDTVLIGSIVATQSNHDALTGTLAMRYGINNRFEAEMRIPYMYRNDKTTNTVVNANQTNAVTSLSDHGLGDIEGALHYQFNEGTGQWPIFVGNLRVKSDTGTSPYEVRRDINGVEQELATGSGFWGVEPSVTVIAPSDPAVFYGNIGYLYNLPTDINSQITANQSVLSVRPGGAIRTGMGMGISLNEKVAFTIGYQHDWILPSRIKFNTGTLKTGTLNVGTMTFGVNWQITPETALNVGVGVGVTNDAPDVSLMVRLPIAVKLFD